MKNFIKKHNKILIGIGIIILAVLGYFIYTTSNKSQAATQYVIATVSKQTLVVSISGTGQVSTSNQVDLKTKVSADITYLGAVVGQEVKTGALLAQLDSQAAQKSVRDAQASLDNAKLAMAKLQQSSDALSLLQAQNSLTQAQETKLNAQNNLEKSYDDGFNTVSNVFLELPNVMSGLTDIILGNDLSSGQQNLDYYADVASIFDEKAIQYKNDTYNSYNIARAAYNKNFADYKSASRFSDTSVIELLINESYETTKDIAEAIKNANNLIQFYKDNLTAKNMKILPLADTHLTSLASYTQKTNSHISSLLSIKNTIQDSKQSIINADRSIAEKTQSLANLEAGPDALDVQTQQLTIQQREDALSEAKQSLVDYSVRAPFDGVIVTVDVKKGDPASSGTTIATLITNQQIAEISLNEIDAAKVKVGQKATMTFDAISDLTLTGQVVEVDMIGTVSQGVVSYNVKIGFDTQDERIKSGMSVTADIITDVKQDVLAVPSSAVKSQNGQSYVQIFNSSSANLPLSASASSQITSEVAPENQTVTVGVSNDTMTEITGGINEGDTVVVQTVTSGTSVATSNSSTGTQRSGSSGIRIPGLGGGF